MNNYILILKKIDALKCAKIAGTVAAILSLLTVMVGVLFSSILGLKGDLEIATIFGGSLLMILIAPFLYYLFSFIIVWICVSIFNFILKKSKGIEIEFEKKDDFINQIGKE